LPRARRSCSSWCGTTSRTSPSGTSRCPFATEGLDAARTIATELPQTAILVLSAHVKVEAADLVRSGFHSGFLLKHRVLDVATFLDALDQIVAGGRVIEPAPAR
jgi:DNA-binding NarL/FixJ family response regulator